MTPNPARTQTRRIGAIAGLAPALAAVVVLVVLGATPSREAMPWFVGVVLVAVGAGWLVGPRVSGWFPADLWTAVAYGVVGSMAYLLAGVTVSTLSGPAIEGDPVPGLAVRVVGQVAYGLLYLPLATGVLTPFGLIWVVAVRVGRRRGGLRATTPNAGVAEANRRGLRFANRRTVVLVAALIVAYGLFVAGLPLVLYNEPRPPWANYRPVALVALFSIPAAVAVAGAVSRRRSLLLAAGAICLFQSYIAFSLVTIGFMVPALLLLTAGADPQSGNASGETSWSLAVPILVIGLAVGAWVATLGMTEEVCWSATRTADGSIVYERIPATNVMTVPPGGYASGCDGGTLTLEGMGVGGALGIGAIALAAASGWGRRAEIDPA